MRRIPDEPTQSSSSTSQDVRFKDKEDSKIFSLRILFVSYLALLAILTVVLTAVAATVIFLLLKVLSLEEANLEEKESLIYSCNILLNLTNKYDVLHNKSLQRTITIQSLIDVFNNTQTELNQFNTSITPLIDKRNHLNKITIDITVEVQGPYWFVANYYSSCLTISQLNSYISGNYILKSSTGVLVSVSCNLNPTSGNSSNVTNNTVVNNFTEKIRVAELDLNNCPQGLRTYYVNSRYTYAVVNDEAGCTEIHYPTNNINYTQNISRVQGF